MNKTYLLALAVALVAAPLAYAHDLTSPNPGVPGTPKPYCEDAKGDTGTHEYGPPVTGHLIFFAYDASVPPCPYDPMWDGHYEYTHGGGWLLACETGCGAGSTGDGSLGCWGTYADHVGLTGITVIDLAVASVRFVVASDTIDNIPSVDPTEPECGDFEADDAGLCTDSCSVGWDPGQDGSYVVFVCGGATQGHIIGAGAGDKLKPGSCTDLS